MGTQTAYSSLLAVPADKHNPVVADNFLAAYFRDLAIHPLLSAEEELLLAKQLASAEIAAWRTLLSSRRTARFIALSLAGKLEPRVHFAPLAAAYGLPVKTKAARALRVAAVRKEITRTAALLRASDLDRHHIDWAIRELSNANNGHLLGTAKRLLPRVLRSYRRASVIRDTFVRSNLRLVVTMARRFDRGGMPLADLIQEGNLGLIHAVGRYDHARALRFSTYACWWIRHAIGRALADKARAVRIPVHMLEAQQQLHKVQQRLTAELGRPPTPQEVAKEARLPLAKINQMHRYLLGQAVSLDRPVHDDDDRTMVDTIADPASDTSPVDTMTMRAIGSQLTEMVGLLSPIESEVIRQRFGLSDDEERTFREIGDRYHLSRERIRQIQNAALGKLRKALEREHRGLVVY